ncbi:MAG: peptidylprolyl isomerase [Bacteroidetes bacterium]|nr:peptidylprolyl isomerase [Bacteroidota bacterium]
MRKKAIVFSIIVSSLVATAFAQEKKSEHVSPATDTLKREYKVLISTEFGDMTVKLYNSTPKHRDNFVKLVQQGFYDSLLFHRVIRNFMIQGGDPQSKNASPGVMLGNGDVGYTIPAEFVDTIFHKKGALCAARTDNPEKASSGCQFYIVQGQVLSNEQLNMFEMQRGMKLSAKQREIMTTIGGTPFLDQNYTVYGEVINGLDVIDKIAAVKTAPGDRPVQDVRMKMKLIQ